MKVKLNVQTLVFYALSAGFWIMSVACSGAEFELHYIDTIFFLYRM
jgi:hypothetical protein